MSATFRAAYIPAEAGSTGGGLLLTTRDDAHLSDADLLAKARAEAEEFGATGDIAIGDWTE